MICCKIAAPISYHFLPRGVHMVSITEHFSRTPAPRSSRTGSAHGRPDRQMTEQRIHCLIPKALFSFEAKINGILHAFPDAACSQSHRLGGLSCRRVKSARGRILGSAGGMDGLKPFATNSGGARSGGVFEAVPMCGDAPCEARKRALKCAPAAGRRSALTHWSSQTPSSVRSLLAVRTPHPMQRTCESMTGRDRSLVIGQK